VSSDQVDRRSLAAALRKAVRGEVRFDAGARALYSTGASNYRQVPIGVVVPRDTDDVEQTVAICREHDAPLLPRGGGTSLAGQVANVAVVLDFSKYMHELLDLDADRKRARVQPGLVLDDLRRPAERHGLTFAPDPSTHAYCTLGGMIGNNSCGVHSVMGGLTADNVEELEILTYAGERMHVGAAAEDEFGRLGAGSGRRGEIFAQLRALRDRYGDLVRERYPKIPRRVSGYNLDRLLPESGFNVAQALVGTEGTCVIVLEATLRLLRWPPERTLVVLAFPDVYTAADRVLEVLAHEPIGLEGLDDILLENMRKKGLHPEDVPLLPEGGGWLLVEFGGETAEEAGERARRLIRELGASDKPPAMKVFDDPDEAHHVWNIRESGLGATARVPGEPDTWEGWEDAAVPPERLGDYLRDFRKLLNEYGYLGALYGHFGQGCIHTRTDFELTSADGIRRFRSFVEDAADLVVSYDGSLSGEHGDGQSRAELLPRMFGEELVGAFREFKTIWDPDGKMNPGKVVDPYRLDDNLRLGIGYNPPRTRTHFRFPGDDRGSFARATLRCVGVGKCRKRDAGTMCPSYMATREEMHSTRGRARLLFEMLHGDPLRGSWRDEHVKEALDLCLACKACKSECPVNVDMATYKAEFLAHYYARRLRPPHAYAFGLIHRWARLAAVAPGLANPVAGAALTKRLLGVAPERRLPPFAPESFRRWFQRRPLGESEHRVILWPDTFNNYFRPQTAQAAVEVLEAAGYRVEIPEQVLCCGRPLYDYGMLGGAKRLLRRTLAALRPEIRAGVPLVGLEPSCVAVFRDELLELLPDDEDAKRLARQTFLFTEFLARSDGLRLAQLRRNALVHGHCHQKAILGMDGDRALLSQLGLDYEILDSGCCGMAGAFGFEKAHYDVSIACGERVLLPAAREADGDTLIIADGFSCREQIEQVAKRETLHLAEVIQIGIRTTNGGEER
jgi:FAD/FMN-containing dehydrogenase/Fe-S oxidoreductase